MSETQMGADEQDQWPMRSRFQKKYQPYGVQLTPETAEEIDDYHDCRVMRDQDGAPVGVEVQTREGALDDVGMGAWIMEDSEGHHYPIADEELQETYEPIEAESSTGHTETDVEPTPGPWQADVDHQPNDTPLILAHTKPKGQVHVVAEANQNGLLEGDWKANARLIAAAGSAAQEAKEMGYDPQMAVEALPKLIEATDCGGPVSDALCALKQAADFIEHETDSKLGAARLHRLADEAAESVGLEIKVASNSAEGSEE